MFNERFDYWRPQFKFQLVEYFVSNNILTRAKANRMRFKNLYGKYKEYREKGVLSNENKKMDLVQR